MTKKISKSPVKKGAKTRATTSPGGKRPRPSGLQDSIKAAALIAALEDHILGRTEMTATQVSAALALLKKILPDMSDPTRTAAASVGLSHEDALKQLE